MESGKVSKKEKKTRYDPRRCTNTLQVLIQSPRSFDRRFSYSSFLFFFRRPPHVAARPTLIFIASSHLMTSFFLHPSMQPSSQPRLWRTGAFSPLGKLSGSGEMGTAREPFASRFTLNQRPDLCTQKRGKAILRWRKKVGGEGR